MKVERIFNADIYRDGGSYGFCFDSDDGHWYEFFIRIHYWSDPNEPRSYDPPVIYFEGCNKRQVAERMTWEEAKAFLEPLHFDDDRFQELVEIVRNEGRD